VLGDVRERESAFSLGSLATAASQESTEPAIPIAIHCPQQNRAGVDKSHFRTDDQLEIRFLGGDMSTDHASQAVSIGDRQSSVAKHGRLDDQLAGMGRTFQKRKVCLAMKLNIRDRRCGRGSQVSYGRLRIEFGMRLFWHDRSVEKAVEKPATIALVVIHPDLCAVFPFRAVIVALDVLRAPPTRRDPFRPP
jgi:hypothetical protein